MRPILLLLCLIPVQDPAPAGRELFDGKTLDGWAATPFANAGKVAVEDGAMSLAEGNAMTGITSTRTDLPKLDYELSYEARREDGRDFFAAATLPVGDAFVSLINGGWGSTVTGLSSINGADASENPTRVEVRYENGRWYRFRVRVTKHTVRVWIDEKPVIDLDTRDVALSTRVEMHRSKPLGFASWRTKGALRAIRIRPLTPAEVAELNARPADKDDPAR